MNVLLICLMSPKVKGTHHGSQHYIHCRTDGGMRTSQQAWPDKQCELIDCFLVAANVMGQ